MKIVLDTNVLIASLGKKSAYRKIFDGFLFQQFTLILSNDVLLEYLEIVQQKTNASIAENVIKSLLSADNIELHDIFFHWELIPQDQEDNKFSDLAIAANADYLVTNDSQFNILKMVNFPVVNVIKADELLELLK
jgi:uncharacterized protein